MHMDRPQRPAFVAYQYGLEHGTQIDTGRLSTGLDGTGSPGAPIAGEPPKSSLPGTQRDRPGRQLTHFETAPFDRSGTSPRPADPSQGGGKPISLAVTSGQATHPGATPSRRRPL